MEKCLCKSSEYSPLEKNFSDTNGRNGSLWIDAIVWKHTINTVYYSKYYHLYDANYNSFEELVHNAYKIDTWNCWMANLSEWTVAASFAGSTELQLSMPLKSLRSLTVNGWLQCITLEPVHYVLGQLSTVLEMYHFRCAILFLERKGDG